MCYAPAQLSAGEALCLALGHLLNLPNIGWPTAGATDEGEGTTKTGALKLTVK